MQSTHFRFPCPSCQHPLRVRKEYVGRDVQCKHCAVSFRVLVPDERALGPDGDPQFTVETVGPAPSGTSIDSETTVAVDRVELHRLQEELKSLQAARDAQKADGERLKTLTTELETAQQEVDRLRTEASAAAERARRVTELEAENDGLRSQTDQVSEQVAALRAEIAVLSAQPAEPALPAGTVAVEDAEWGRLQAELREARSERDDALASAARLRSLEADLAAARVENDAMRIAASADSADTARTADLEGELQTAKTEQARLLVELDRLQSELELSKTAATTGPTLADSKIAVERTEWDQLQRNAVDLRSTQQELETARGRIASLTADLHAAQVHSEQAQSTLPELRRLAARVPELEQETRNLETERDRQQTELAALRSERDEWDAARTQLTALQQAYQTLQDKHTALAARQTQQAGEHEALLAEHRQLNLDHERRGGELDQLESERELEKRGREQLPAELQQARADHEALHVAHQRVNADLERLRAEHEQQGQFLAEQQRQTERLESALADSSNAAQLLAELRAEYESICADRDRLTAQVTELREQRQADQEAHQDIENRLNRELERLRAECEKQTKDIAEQQRKAERLETALADASGATDLLAELRGEHERACIERDRLAAEATALREQAAEYHSYAERLAALQDEHDGLRDRSEAQNLEIERLQTELGERDLALAEGARSQESALAALKQHHADAASDWQTQRETARAEWDQERQGLQRQLAETLARLDGERATSQAQIESVRAEATQERNALKAELTRLRTESDRGRSLLEGSTRRIEQLVRSHEHQTRQRREVEAVIQRLEEAQQREDADAERNTEESSRIAELERQLAEARRAHPPANASEETSQLWADLTSAREKIQELTELLEASEEDRANIQATLRALGIRVH